MATTRGILWDFDRTLAYRDGLWSDLLVELLDLEMAGHGYKASVFRPALSRGFPWHDWQRPHPDLASADAWWRFVTLLLQDALLDAGLDPALGKRVAQRARAEYLRPDRWRLYPDTLAALDALAAEGWRHVVLSNHCPELPEIASSLGIAERVDAIVNSAATGYEKPHAEAFRLGRVALGNPDVVWMLGDNPEADVAGARRVGIPGILVRQTRPADGLASDLTEALAILGAGREPLVPRLAARVLLLDEADRLLLVKVRDPGTERTFWATPGGGLEPGESFEAAARREVAEETGLTDLRLGPCVWTREDQGVFAGRRFHVSERIFVARVFSFEPTDIGYTELEREVQTEARWWTLAELERSQEEFAPAKLPLELARLLATGITGEPIDVGV